MNMYLASIEMHKKETDKITAQLESLQNSIIAACEMVGKDAGGIFPFNAHALAERIIGLESLAKDQIEFIESIGQRDNFYQYLVEGINERV